MVILKNQSVFLANRLIIDNVLVGYELIHSLKQKRNGKIGFATMKLDMSRAFDLVEWSFLEKVMLQMGFCSAWVNLIMKSI